MGQFYIARDGEPGELVVCDPRDRGVLERYFGPDFAGMPLFTEEQIAGYHARPRVFVGHELALIVELKRDMQDGPRVLIPECEPKHRRRVGSAVVEMDEGRKDELAAAEAAGNLRNEREREIAQRAALIVRALAIQELKAEKFLPADYE